VASLWKKVANKIKKTRTALAEGLDQVFTPGAKLDEALLEELEEVLLMSDVGLDTATVVIDRLRSLARERGVSDAGAARGLMQEVVAEILTHGKAVEALAEPAPNRPKVILMVGVNGAGKTTSIGKLAKKYKSEGRKPMVVACDTYRAAAMEQLQIWAERAGAEIVRSQSGADPASVAYDGVVAGTARGMGVIFVDTAGRLQTNTNLMKELTKIRRVIEKAEPTAPHETLLVLDATVGQNALSQTRHFAEAAGVTGIILAKLDGSAKGGVILAVSEQVGIPVRYVGLGEGIDDLSEFEPAEFAKALMAPVD
jgi:fused signal recognition particle receptor